MDVHWPLHSRSYMASYIEADRDYQETDYSMI